MQFGSQSDEVPGYLPVSRLAVAAAALGGISALALASPVFWVLPLVTIAIAVAALRDVARPEAPKAGRLAAIAGLALAVGFGAQAVAAKATARSIAAARAGAAARLWLDTIHEQRLADARSICGLEAAGSVDAVAACGASDRASVIATSAGEREGTWLVRAKAGTCTIEITLEPMPAEWQGRPGERWMVTMADVVRPSAN
ncbi:MAG: hypothetical protein ACK54F_12330 [Planctomycetia bacterium]|jgi:hypothetical protein